VPLNTVYGFGLCAARYSFLSRRVIAAQMSGGVRCRPTAAFPWCQSSCLICGCCCVYVSMRLPNPKEKNGSEEGKKENRAPCVHATGYFGGCTKVFNHLIKFDGGFGMRCTGKYLPERMSFCTWAQVRISAGLLLSFVFAWLWV